MPLRTLTNRLISAKTKRERENILLKTPRKFDLEIAHNLKNICYEVWTSEPAIAQKAASALQNLLAINSHKEIEALAFWVAGIAELTRGKLENSIDKSHTNPPKSSKKSKKNTKLPTHKSLNLSPLALLGKYDEAIKSGKKTLKIFEKYGDELSAGKVEKNLGNIVARQNNLSKSMKNIIFRLEKDFCKS